MWSRTNCTGVPVPESEFVDSHNVVLRLTLVVAMKSASLFQLGTVCKCMYSPK
jgi:hypothetical protein